MVLSKHLGRRMTPDKNSGQVIALLSDFGLHDQYAAVMKGVILTLNPTARIVDITHDVLPHKIRQGGYLLWTTYQYFPKGTIFVGVVDPGVGSARLVIVVKTKQFTFLAPNNGLLDFILNESEVLEAVELTEKTAAKYTLNEISSTFHGRDVFAPLAAHLSKGLALKQLGVPFIPPGVLSPFVHSRSDVARSSILHIDHFGNIVTNLTSRDFDRTTQEIQAISLGRNLVSRWIRFYDEAPENTPCLIVGSNKLVEISAKNNSAAHLLNATLDTALKIYWR